MKTYLITGNLGYIGVELTKKLKKNPCIVIGVDNNYFSKTLNKQNEFSPKQNVDIQYNCDIRDINFKQLNKVDCVIHLSAVSNDPIGNYFQKPTKEINFNASKRLFNWCLKNRVKNFVFASSCSIYGSSGDSIKNENDKLEPLTDYAKSKEKFEQFIFLRKSKINISILRFSTACGLSENLRLDLVLNDFVTNGFFKKKIILNSLGNSYRPLIDVEDMCELMIWASNRKKSEIFNVGRNDNNILIKDLATKVSKKIKNCEVIIRPTSKNDKRSYKVSFDSIRRAGYYPKKKLIKSLMSLLNFIIKMIKIIYLKMINFFV